MQEKTRFVLLLVFTYATAGPVTAFVSLQHKAQATVGETYSHNDGEESPLADDESLGKIRVRTRRSSGSDDEGGFNGITADMLRGGGSGGGMTSSGITEDMLRDGSSDSTTFSGITEDMLRGGGGGGGSGSIGMPHTGINADTPRGGGYVTVHEDGDWSYSYHEIFNSSESGASCKDACGVQRVVPCSCDAACFVYKTCCEDVSTQCPSLEQEARDYLGDALVDAGPQHIACHSSGFLVVNSCPTGPDIPLQDEDVFQDFMTATKDMSVQFDSTTGLLYRNRFVYECYHDNATSNHNEADKEGDEGEEGDNDLLQSWTSFHYDWLLYRKNIKINPTSALNTMRKIHPKYAVFYPQSKNLTGHPCANDVFDSCQRSFQHMDPDNQCGQYISYFEEVYADETPGVSFGQSGTKYANRYCFYCHENRTNGNDASSLTVGALGGTGKAIKGTFTENGTLVIRVQGFMYNGWIEAECEHKTQDPITTSAGGIGSERGKKPFCKILKCGQESEILDNRCLKEEQITTVLRYPPKVEGTIFDIIDLTSFITCFLEDKTWPGVPEDERVSMVTVGAAEMTTGLTSIFSSNYNFSEYARLADDPESYFGVHLVTFSGVSGIESSASEAVEDAIQYWHIRKQLVSEMGDGLLLFKNHAGNFSEIENGGDVNGMREFDDANEIVRMNPGAFLHRLDREVEGLIPLFKRDVSEEDKGQLDACFGDVVGEGWGLTYGVGAGSDGVGGGGGGGGWRWGVLVVCVLFLQFAVDVVTEGLGLWW